MKKILILLLSLISFVGYSQIPIDPSLSLTTGRYNLAVQGRVTASGTNTYTGSLTGITSYTDLCIDILFTNASTTTPCTFNLNSLGARTLKKYNSSGSLTDFTTGDIFAGQRLRFYDNGSFLVVESATVTTIPTLSGDVSNSGNAITVTKINGTALSGLATGILKNTTTTGVPSIAVSGTDYALPLTDGNGTTANGTANDLGGTLSSDVNIDGPFSVSLGTSNKLNNIDLNVSNSYSLQSGNNESLILGDPTTGNNLSLLGSNGSTLNQQIDFTDASGIRFRTGPTLVTRASISNTGGMDFQAGSITTYPMSFTSGALMTAKSVGKWGFLTDKLYFTITTSTAEKEITLNDAALTSGRMPFVTTNGRLIDDGSLLYSTSTGISTSKNITLNTIGAGLAIKEGTNAAQGVVTLSAGTATVSNTRVTANSRIQLTAQNLGTITVPVGLAVSARTAGTSFTILSGNLTDTSTIAWTIIEPAP